MSPHLTKGSTGILSTADVAPKLPSPDVPKLRNFTVNGQPILFDVPSNVTLTPSTDGWFVGFDSAEPLSRHVVPIGRLLNIKFMSIFRFKVWWTTHWTGTRGRDLEHETQLLILDKSPSGRPYVLFLPLIEGRFRATLQPGDNDNLDLCVESGSSAIAASSFRSLLYIHTGDDPFTLIPSALKAVKSRLGGDFKLMEEKSPPAIVDKFGWCTWDAFYLRVNPAGILDGVRRLAAGGCPPGLVLIDDGWQSICYDGEDPDHEGMTLTTAGEQMPCRLTKFEENFKFKEYKSPKFGEGLGAFVKDLKESYPSIEHVYVWHALCGYWGGLRPKTVGLPEARLIGPRLSPGLEKTMQDLAVDKIVSNGVGLVEPTKAHELYEGLHSHLEKAGIDGVKVDVIQILEMVCEEYGGRVELAKAYYKGLTESVRKHFKGNGVIASMEHCNDFMFLGTEAISLGRVGDDFWCTDPAGDRNGTFWLQGCHMVHCAYNSLWMSSFIRPDWDMFQSTHPCAHFHAASRAISGGPVYVSDSVGDHDFELLRRLALPDGTILRCEGCALPTRDCLFEDPLHDGRTMLKIWNLNKYTGVMGAFNCQGGGWNREARRNKCASEYSRTITATARPADIEWNKSGTTPITPVQNRNNLFAVYSFRAKTLTLLKPEEEFEVTLDPFNYELYVVSPVSILGECNVRFAPVGLANMLNTGGAIQSVQVVEGLKVRVLVKGAGEMRVYSSERPKGCRIDGEEVGFVYEQEMVAVEVAWSGSSSKTCVVEYLY